MGVNVTTYRYVHTMLGGALAGVGGAFFSLAITPFWLDGMTSGAGWIARSEEHTSELQSQSNLVCRLLLEKKKIEKSDISFTCLISIISYSSHAHTVVHSI